MRISRTAAIHSIESVSLVRAFVVWQIGQELGIAEDVLGLSMGMSGDFETGECVGRWGRRVRW